MSRICPPWSCDPRALALLRIGLACVVLADLFTRSLDLELFYCDTGLFPRQQLVSLAGSSRYINLFLCSGDAVGVSALFILTAVAALALLVGIHTRAASFFTWIFMLGLNHRNPLVTDGGDMQLKVMLFWLMFLPTDRCWTYSNQSHKRASVCNFATFGYHFQLAVIYFFTAVLKSDPCWRSEGTALEWVLHVDQFTTGLGQWLLQFPELLKLFTFAALAIEFAIAPLLLWPVANRWTKTSAMFLIWALHLGIAALLHLGVFVPITLVGALGLMPSWLLDRLESLVKGSADLSNEDAFSPAPKEPWHQKVMIVLTSIFVLTFNVHTLVDPKGSIPKPIYWIGFLTQTHQEWQRFGPHPPEDDGWFVLDGTTVDGRHIDLMKAGQPVDWTKPWQVSAQFVNQRYRRWFQNLYYAPAAHLRKPCCQWWFDQWNQTHGGADRLVDLDFIYMYERTRPPFDQVPQALRLAQVHQSSLQPSPGSNTTY